jgi:ABC-2 type transport system permease protein
MVRGILVGLLTWVVALFFTGGHLVHLGTTVLFLALSAYVFAVLGLIAGIWAEKFEQINFFPTFLMLPLTFLGGVFYSVNHLPEPFRTISLFNPVVHMVEGLRGGMLGLSESSPLGLGLLLGLSVVSTIVAWQMLRVGYKLKS